MHYSCLAEPVADESGYALTSLREVDVLAIASWRNAQMQVLRQSRPLTEDGQLRYYRDVVLPSMSVVQPEFILVSFLLRQCCIGYGGLTHIDWNARRAEVSFLVDTERARDHARYQKDFFGFLGLLKGIAFKRLGLYRLFTETYDIRPHHVAALEAAGFRPEGRLRRHFMIDGSLVDGLFHGILSEDYSD